MKIFDFIKALLPHLDKNKVIEDLRVTSAEIDNFAIPSYTHAVEYFKTNKIKSDDSKFLSEVFYRNFDAQGAMKQSSVVGDVLKRLIFVKENTDYVLKLSEELYERDIINEGLTVKKAILLRAAGNLSFISRFSVDLLNVLYVNEAISVSSEIDEELRLSPASVKYVSENIAKFATLLSDYGIPNKKFSSIILGLPEVYINSKTESSLSGLYKEKDIDPFVNVFKAGFTGNPIYHARLQIAEWQTNRYKVNKDKKKVLELRLLYLKTLQDGQGNAKLEQEINYIQHNRIDKIDRYLNEVEENLAGV